MPARRDPARALGLADAISGHSFGGEHGASDRPRRSARDPQAARRLVRALAVALDARGGRAADARRGLLAEVARGAPRRPSSAAPASSPAFVFAILVDDKSPHGAAIIADSIYRDRWAATAQIIIAACGARRRARRLPRADARGEHRRVLRPARRGRRRDGVLRPGGEPDDALPRARVVLDRALRPVRDRHRPGRLARGRAEVPGRRRRRLGDAALRLGARLRRDRRAQLRQDRRRRAHATTRCSCSASR